MFNGSIHGCNINRKLEKNGLTKNDNLKKKTSLSIIHVVMGKGQRSRMAECSLQAYPLQLWRQAPSASVFGIAVNVVAEYGLFYLCPILPGV